MNRCSCRNVACHFLVLATITAALLGFGCSCEPTVSTADWQTFEGDGLSLMLPSTFSKLEDPSGAVWGVSTVETFVPTGSPEEPRFGVEIPGGWAIVSMLVDFMDEEGPYGRYWYPWEVFFAHGEAGEDARRPAVLAVWSNFEEEVAVEEWVVDRSHELDDRPPDWVNVQIEIEEASEDGARLRVSAPFSEMRWSDKWVEYWVFNRVGKRLYCVIYSASEEAMAELGPVFLASEKTITIEKPQVHVRFSSHYPANTPVQSDRLSAAADRQRR